MEKHRILVWDLPVRVFHWLLVACFVDAYLTAEAERFRGLHAALGYTVAGLLAFRLLWGVIGSRYARFRSFAFGPAAVLTYLRSLILRSPVSYVGHNPAGSYVIYALIALGIATSVSGHAAWVETGGRWLDELHEGMANAMLALVILHVSGVIASSLLHRENLVASMLTGYKTGARGAAIATTRWVTALLLVAGALILWTGAPTVDGLWRVATKAVSNDAGHGRHSRHGLRGHD